MEPAPLGARTISYSSLHSCLKASWSIQATQGWYKGCADDCKTDSPFVQGRQNSKLEIQMVPPTHNIFSLLQESDHQKKVNMDTKLKLEMHKMAVFCSNKESNDDVYIKHA